MTPASLVVASCTIPASKAVMPVVLEAPPQVPLRALPPEAPRAPPPPPPLPQQPMRALPQALHEAGGS